VSDIQQNVPRIPDIPYHTSYPHQFVFQQTAPLALGEYVFDGTKALLTQQPQLIKDALYIFRHITLTADTSVGVYEEAIGSSPGFTPDVPRVQFFFAQGTGAPVFKTPIFMNTFIEGWEYTRAWQNQQSPQQLSANWQGKIRQTGALIGKPEITLKIIVAATEVTDEAYVNDFVHRSYPRTSQMGEIAANPAFDRHFDRAAPRTPPPSPQGFPQTRRSGGYGGWQC